MPQSQQLENHTLLSEPHPIDLGSLDAITGFRLNGVSDFSLSGFPVLNVGDVNGDGFDD